MPFAVLTIEVAYFSLLGLIFLVHFLSLITSVIWAMPRQCWIEARKGVCSKVGCGYKHKKKTTQKKGKPTPSGPEVDPTVALPGKNDDMQSTKDSNATKKAAVGPLTAEMQSSSSTSSPAALQSGLQAGPNRSEQET